MKKFYLFIAVILSIVSIETSAQIITTVAGNGTAGYSGDGGPATAAELDYDYAVATDNSGNYYISGWYGGTGGSRVRKVDAFGVINNFAGNGTPGFSGDGGPATAAQLYEPLGLVTDPSGNVYIADWDNARIRMVNTSGIISTFAGNGSFGYSGDGGAATAAQIGYGWGLACDPSGNIFISDEGYRRIRRVDASTHIITTIAGTGSYGSTGDGGPATAATFEEPEFMTCDASGNLYIADWNVQRVRKIDMSTGIISNYAGTGSVGFSGDGGQATAATFEDPAGIAVDGAGSLYISDFYNYRIRKVNASGIISTIAGNGTWGFAGDGGPATTAEFKYPYGLAVDGTQSVYICDYNNWRVRKINGHNRAPYFTGGHSLNITVCENTIGDSLNSILPIYDSDNYQTETWSVIVAAVHGTAVCADTALSTGGVVPAHGMYYTPATGYSGIDSFKVRIFDGTASDTTEVHVLINPTPSVITGRLSCVVGGYTTLYDSTGGGSWSSATTAVATAGTGTGVVTGISSGTSVVAYTLTATGCNVKVIVTVSPFAGLLIKTLAGNGSAGYSGDGSAALSAKLNLPASSATDIAGNTYIVDYGNSVVRKVTPAGIISTIAGTGTAGFGGDGGPATAALLNGPVAVSVDFLGNIYVADRTNYRIRKINATGVITTVAGNGAPSYIGDGVPATSTSIGAVSGLALDRSGNIYMSDYGDSRVREVNTSGIISTIAGNGTAGFSGDGFAATAAQINVPYGITVDNSGNVYIGDQSNYRIRKINTSGVISTIAGTGTGGYSGDGSSALTANISVYGLANDAFGNVYFADATSSRIRKINTSGIISTVAGNGTAGFGGDACIATGSVLNGPVGVAVDYNDNIYIADQSNQRIREITNNHAPVFVGGHIQYLSLCQNTSYDSINSLMTITDADNGQGETWSTVFGPGHGTLSAAYTATSTGGSVFTHGMWYTPAISYAGPDSFKVVVMDCSGGTDTTFVRITVNLPAAPITGTLNVCVGLTTTLSDAVTGGVWTSSNPAAGTIGSASGIVTGLAAGVTNITYSPGAGCSASTTVTVNAAPSAITGNPNICIGSSNTFSDATIGGTWSSSSSGAPVTSGGVVNGLSLGAANITYSSSGCPSIMAVTVDPLPPGITGVGSVCQGSGATLLDIGSVGGTWTSGSPAIGTIDAHTGIIMGMAPGYTFVTYTLPTGCATSFLFLVDGTPSAITGVGSVCIGGTITLVDTTVGGLWSSSGLFPSGTVDIVTGAVTGVALGTATISYTVSGCAATAVVTVNSTPSAITGPLSVCMGSPDTLSNSISGGVWTSGTHSTALVGTSGIISTAAPGTTIITYGVGTCIATATLTVNALPSIISGPTSVCVGLTAAETDSVSGGTWSMSPSAYGTISSTGVVHGLAAGVATITYTNGGGCSITKLITVNTAPSGILGSLNVCPGTTTALTDGGGGTWTSGTPASGTISTTGVVTGLAPGTTLITYSLGVGCTATATVTVNPLPSGILGSLNVCPGTTTLLTDGTSGGSWSMANTNATVSGSIVLGVTGGTTDNITYTLPLTGCYTTKTVTINPLPAPFPSWTVCAGSSITLSPTGTGLWSATGAGSVVAGTGVLSGTASGTALVTYTLSGTGCARSTAVTVNAQPALIGGPMTVCQGSSITLTDITTGGTWSTLSSAATVVGSTGTVTGSSSGTAIITYSAAITGCARTATVTVNALPGTIGGPTALCLGANILLTDGIGTWVSSNTAVATIGSTTGIVAGIDTGTSNITFTNGAGCKATTAVTVSLAPKAITGPGGVCTGATIALTDTINGGVWSSSALAYGSIGSLSGIVTGVSSGTTIITYSLGTGCTVTKPVTVSAAPATITGGTNICIGTTSLLGDATTSGTWSATPGSVATITTGGTVNGVGAGTAIIDYSTGGCYATTTVTVNPTPTTITGPLGVCEGSSVTELNGTSGGTWSTTSTNISVTGSTGNTTGITAGAATVTYSIGTCTVNRTISVDPTGTISGATGVCRGTTTLLGESVSGGSWTSTPTTIATITSGGTVSGIANGTAVIDYTTPAGCKATTNVTVNSAPGPITGILHVCIDGTTVLGDSTGGGTWTAAHTIIMLGSSDGTVTGLATGTIPVTYSIGTGCTVYATVTVNTPPAPIRGTLSACTGNTSALTDTTSGGIWTSGATSTATIGSLTGIATGVSAGTVTLSYTPSAGCAALALFTVNPLPNPVNGTKTVCAGLTTALSDTLTGGTWSTTGSVATVGSITGVVTGSTPGTAVITYVLPTGCSNTTNVSVNAAPVSIAGPTAMCIGSGITLTDASGGGSWSSPDGAGIIILGSGSGAVSGVGLGTATVSYTIGGCPSVTTVTVNSLPGAITGNNTICAGSIDTLGDITSGGVWTSSVPATASIIGPGYLAGVVSGTVMVTYSMGAGCNVSKSVTVKALPAAVTGPTEVCYGYTINLHDATTGGAWSSQDAAIASINTSGVVTGNSGGTAVMSYTSSLTGCSALYPVAVQQVPAITGANNMCALGDTMTVYDAMAGGSWTSTSVTVSPSGGVLSFVAGGATITYTMPTGCFVTTALTVNPTPAPILGNDRLCIGTATTLTNTSTGGVWSSTPVTTATATGGTITGVNTGTAVVAYTFPITGCAQYVTVTVEALPSAIAGTAQVCAGATTTLMDTTTGGSWTSGSTAIATVSPVGIVSGVLAGTTTITYTMGAACTATKTVTVAAVPDAYTVTGGGNYCSSGTGVHIGLTDGATGVTYGLYNGSTASGTATGAGTAIDFGLLTAAGVYTVTATNAAGCEKDMTGSAVISITPSVTPAISIAATSGIVLCAGVTADLISTETNGGTPTYTWLVNGAVIAGATTGSYSYTPANGDVITAVMNSTAACASPATVTSNAVTMTVNPELVPTVVVTAVPGTVILAGENDVFTAVVTNGGSTPTYQWEKNGIPIPGATSSTYSSTNLATGDTITCDVTSSGPCGGNSGASNHVGIRLFSNVDVGTVSVGADVTVLPNPNNGSFFVRGTIGTIDETVGLELTDMLGQVVYRNSAATNNGKLDVQVQLGRNIANGMYLLNVRTAGGNNVFHVVVEQ